MNKLSQLEDKVAIITGGSQGLGLEIAKHFICAGANLMLCARDELLLEEAKRTLQEFTKSNQSIQTIAADVSKTDDVQRIFNTTIDYFDNVDILVNNAGIYGPTGEVERNDWNEWVRTIEINLLGSVLMCRSVVPIFKIRNKGKIIQLSGGGATNPLPFLSSYAVSKAAIIRFVETLAEEVRAYNIDVNAIAPGALNTRMLAEILEAGPNKVGKEFYAKALKQKDMGGVPLSVGAKLAVYLASSSSDGVTGKLISALWDDWEHFADNLQELGSSDVYTLRRIIAKDRGFEWGDK